MKGKRKKPTYWIWGILVIVLVGGIVWSNRSSLMSGTLTFAVAQTGTITHERKVPATFANQEFPLQAPFAGKIQFLGSDGQRFRRGETIATLQPEGAAPGTKADYSTNQTLVAPSGGLFFRQTDGLESVITNDNLATMDLDKLLTQQANAKSPETTVQSGEIVGKIVNNLVPTMAFLELPKLDGLTVGKTMRITVGGQTMSAKILRKSDKPTGVVVQFPHYIDGSAGQRRQEVTWVSLPPVSGVLVPKSALWVQGEEQGVYVVVEGVVHFKKVKILDQDDQNVCVENLASGIPVVVTPREGLEGVAASVKNL